MHFYLELSHYSFQETNKISQKLKIKTIYEEDDTKTERTLEEISGILQEFKSFQDYIGENEGIYEYIDNDLIQELIIVFWKIRV